MLLPFLLVGDIKLVGYDTFERKEQEEMTPRSEHKENMHLDTTIFMALMEQQTFT